VTKDPKGLTRIRKLLRFALAVALAPLTTLLSTSLRSEGGQVTSEKRK